VAIFDIACTVLYFGPFSALHFQNYFQFLSFETAICGCRHPGDWIGVQTIGVTLLFPGSRRLMLWRRSGDSSVPAA